MAMYDVAIVGGGLAGLSLSIQLARQGHQVILFEKNTYPFHKVCGEYIAMESWGFLERLGLDLASQNLPRIQRFQVSDTHGNLLEQPLDPGGFGISRYSLDQQLAQLARDAGVTLYEKTTVKGFVQHEQGFEIGISQGTTQSTIESRLFCGSYGKYANLDVKLGRGFIAPHTRQSAFAAIKYHVEMDFPDDLVALHNFKGGYCGMSRIEDGRSCVCYLVHSKVLKQAGSIAELEKSVLYQNPHLKRVFAQSKSLYEQPLAITQIHFQPKSACEQGVLMLGDAAGLIPPLCGNGMSMALYASHLLGPLINSFLQNQLSRQQLEISYTQQWQAAFATRLRVGRLLQHCFGHALPTNILINGLKPLPSVTRRLIALTHGKAF